MSMNTFTKEILKPKTKQSLLSFSIKRTSQGVEINLKSEKFYDFFKQYGVTSYDEAWCGNKPFQVPLVKEHFKTLLNHWYGDLFVNTSYPNLSFLRSDKLKDGCKFIIENQVYTRGEITDFAKKFKDEITELFTEYVKPVTMEVELITEIRAE